MAPAKNGAGGGKAAARCRASVPPPARANRDDLPPSSNRGVTVTVHWLSLTYFTNPAKAMAHFLQHFLGYSLENEMEWSEYFFAMGHGARSYRSLWTGPEGVRLYGYPDTGQHCHLEIQGNVLESFGLEHVRNYLFSLTNVSFEWQCTRIDVAFDYCPLTPTMCNEARQIGNIRTRAHQYSWKWFENNDGNTLYIGTRKSGRMIRIYDKRGPTRLEMEFRDKWANKVCEILATSPAKYWLFECMGILRDFVDFVDAEVSGENISRAPLLSWWDTFIDGAEKAELQIGRTQQAITAMSMERYLQRLLPTLCVMRHGLGVSLDSLADSILDGLPTKHLSRIRVLKGEH